MEEFLNTIQQFFADNEIWKYILDGYFALFIVAFVVFLCVKMRRALYLTLIGTLLFLIAKISDFLGLTLSNSLYTIFLSVYLIICVVILAPDLRKIMEVRSTKDTKKTVTSATQTDKEAVADAVFNMASQKVGALITFEMNTSLGEFSTKAITLNADISRELLEQIFIKDTPLHDGGVIIRGNKIVCAGAYYRLSQDTSIEKTTGSRHRAGIGISSETDSISIIVSEETGSVHMAVGGNMRPIESKKELLDNIELFQGQSSEERNGADLS